MKNFFTKTIIISIIAVLAVLYIGSFVLSGYNSLIKGNIAIDTQWAQVENQLQRQFDLIPNLQATVKGASANERSIFLGIAEARKAYSGAQTVDGKVAAASAFQAGLGRLTVSLEAYPNVQSTQAYRDLTVSLEGSQNRISVERGRFNDLVGSFNILTKTFPTNLIAKLFGFNAREFFKVEESAKATPKIDFSN